MHFPNANLRTPYPDTIGLDRAHLLLFSAHDEPTLKNNLQDHASQCGDNINALDLAYTLACRRTKLLYRTFSIGMRGTLLSDIQAATSNIMSKPQEPARPAFVFTGMYPFRQAISLNGMT